MLKCEKKSAGEMAGRLSGIEPRVIEVIVKMQKKNSRGMGSGRVGVVVGGRGGGRGWLGIGVGGTKS